jgi:hypothetical protein
MKKLNYISLLLVAIVLYSCGESTEFNKIIEDRGTFSINIKAPKNNGSEIVSFMVLNKEKLDSLDIEEKILVDMAKSSVLKTKSFAQHPLTFEYSNSGTIGLSSDGSQIVSTCRGNGENSYGVKGSISSLCYHDLKGELKECIGL